MNSRILLSTLLAGAVLSACKSAEIPTHVPSDETPAEVRALWVARMAYRTFALTPGIQPIDQVLLDKHFLRKHGANAYYGQS